MCGEVGQNYSQEAWLIIQEGNSKKLQEPKYEMMKPTENKTSSGSDLYKVIVYISELIWIKASLQI